MTKYNPMLHGSPQHWDNMRKHAKGGDGGGSYYENANKLYGTQADTAQFMLDIGKENLPGAVDRYKTAAMQYQDPAYAERMAGEAATTAQQSIDQTTGTLNRNMARYGINPASGKWAGMSNQNAAQGAAIKAGAVNQARVGVEDKKFGAAKDFYASLVGMPSDAAAQAGQAASGMASIGNAKNNAAAQDNAAIGNIAGLGYTALTMKDGGSVQKPLHMASGGGIGIGTDPLQRSLRSYITGENDAHLSPKEAQRRAEVTNFEKVADPLGVSKLFFKDGGSVRGYGAKMAAGGLFQAGTQMTPPPPTSQPVKQQLSPSQIKLAAQMTKDGPSGFVNSMSAKGGKIMENVGSMTGNTELAAQGVGTQATAAGQDLTGAIQAYKGAGMNDVAGGLAAGAGDAGTIALGTSAEQGAMLAAQNAGLGAGAEAATASALGGAGTAAGGTAAAGGMTGAMAGAAAAMPWLAAGVAVGSLLGLFADGGEVDRKNMIPGGDVKGPGGATEDKIPAWLSDGEFVVNAESVKMPGVKKMLKQVNEAGLEKRGYGAKKYADGGFVEKVRGFFRDDPDKTEAERKAELAKAALGTGKTAQAANTIKSRKQQIDDELKKQLGYASGGEVKVHGGARSFKDKNASGIEGGAHVNYELSPNATVGADVSGYKVKYDGGKDSRFGVDAITGSYRKGDHEISGRVDRGGGVNLNYQYNFSDGGEVKKQKGYGCGGMVKRRAA